MCSFLSGKGPKYRGFCVRLSPKITLAEEKERKNREEQKGRRIEKKCNDCTLRFYFGDVLNEEKKMPHGKGLFGGKVFKNSSRYIVCKNTFS